MCLTAGSDLQLYWINQQHHVHAMPADGAPNPSTVKLLIGLLEAPFGGPSPAAAAACARSHARWPPRPAAAARLPVLWLPPCRRRCRAHCLALLC